MISDCMKVVLEVVGGPEAGRAFEFRQADSFLVGRSPKAHFVLDAHADRQISRHHFLLDIRPPRCIIQDLDSTNGTFVNRQKILKAELNNGDNVRVGKTRIRVAISSSDEAEAHQVQCEVCGRDVTSEISDPAPDLPYTCIACTKVRQNEADFHTPSSIDSSLRPLQTVCSVCYRDLSERADSDGRADELPDSTYLCPTCAVTQRFGPDAGKKLGAFRIISELGRGGMGVVYKVVHETSRRLCAIKQILPDAARDDKAMRQFDREIGVQSMVVHPNLARVLERGRTGQSCYFVVEYLPGGDVNRLVSKIFNGPVETGLACRIGLQVLSGLIALHEHGFVHRDLKPPNFLLSRSYDDPLMTTKITDYGLAKSFEEAGNSMFDLTRGGEVAGSMMFMPPEQILDYRFVRPPTDVYAVGVSLYFLLTAKYTVDFPTTIKKFMAGAGKPQRNPIQAILDDPPIPIRERFAGVPQHIAEVVDCSVQKDLEKRYATATEFRDELQLAFDAEGLR